MAIFTEQERAYLESQRLGRLATVDAAGRPHVVPVGFRFDPDEQVIAIGGHNLAATKKFRDAGRHPAVAFVVDDLASVDPWIARGIEIRGSAETIPDGGEPLGPGFGGAWIRIAPERIVVWGIGGAGHAARSVR
jgi:pyridoxamine 5'-phosphate oxidase family protein